MAYVLDAAGFFAGIHLGVNGKVYAPPQVLREVKDAHSRRALELGLSGGKVVILNPSKGSVRNVSEISSKLGEFGRLSDTDIAVLALAKDLMNICKRVVVVSDDRSVQNVALRMGATVMGVKREPLKKPRRYLYICPYCGRVFKSPGVCPHCGVKLRRVREDKIKSP
ncbi:MAG: NOB1 family endonuclease [Desulfurococcales archaeon]|nr:NOB1 family endonuclease [Desulfurococcales archaeon]